MTYIDTLLSLRAHRRGRHRAATAAAVDLSTAARSAYAVLTREAGLTVLGGFLLYVLLSAYAGELTDTALPGGLNAGVGLGLLQLTGFFAFAVHGLRAERDELAAAADPYP